VVFYFHFANLQLTPTPSALKLWQQAAMRWNILVDAGQVKSGCSRPPWGKAVAPTVSVRSERAVVENFIAANLRCVSEKYFGCDTNARECWHPSVEGLSSCYTFSLDGIRLHSHAHKASRITSSLPPTRSVVETIV
jgi:hypothetical protein